MLKSQYQAGEELSHVFGGPLRLQNVSSIQIPYINGRCLWEHRFLLFLFCFVSLESPCCLKYVGEFVACYRQTAVCREKATPNQKPPTISLSADKLNTLGERSLKLHPETIFVGGGGTAI